MSPQPADSSPPDVADSFVAERPRGAVRREMLSTVYYDRWRIGAVFLLGLALTLLAVQMAPNKYVAEASLLLRLGREYVYTPEVGDPGVSGAPVAYDREQTIAAETRILTSRDLIDSVVKKVGVQNIYPKIAASGNDPAAIQGAATLNLERALEYIDVDEYVEATPKNLRSRKKVLDEIREKPVHQVPRGEVAANGAPVSDPACW